MASVSIDFCKVWMLSWISFTCDVIAGASGDVAELASSADAGMSPPNTMATKATLKEHCFIEVMGFLPFLIGLLFRRDSLFGRLEHVGHRVQVLVQSAHLLNHAGDRLIHER